MADLSGDRGGLIPAYNPGNQLDACFRQNVSGKSVVTSIAVTHLARETERIHVRWCRYRGAPRTRAGSM
jgi:hypothetical protein